MTMLSDDDLNLEDMNEQELAAAWDLWFDLAQATNEHDPPYEHGVFAGASWEEIFREEDERTPDARPT